MRDANSRVYLVEHAKGTYDFLSLFVKVSKVARRYEDLDNRAKYNDLQVEVATMLITSGVAEQSRLSERLNDWKSSHLASA